MNINNHATIVFERKQEYIIKDEAISLMIDGKEISKINPGEISKHKILPGIHEIYIQIGWHISDRIEEQIIAGKTYNYICGSNWGGWRYFVFRFNVRPWFRLYLKKL